MSEDKSVTLLLLHVHDHIWRDKTFPLKIRDEACKKIQRILGDIRLKKYHRIVVDENIRLR